MPFEGGKSLTWDVTVVCSTADSYIDLTVQGPGCAAEIAASRKVALYVHLFLSSSSLSLSFVVRRYTYKNIIRPTAHNKV